MHFTRFKITPLHCCLSSFVLNVQRLQKLCCQFLMLLNVTNSVSSWFPSNILFRRSIEPHTWSEIAREFLWLHISCLQQCWKRITHIYIHAKKYLCTIINGVRHWSSWQQSEVHNFPSIVYLKWLIHFIYGFLMTLPVNKFAHYTGLWVNYQRWDCIKCNFPTLLSAKLFFFPLTLMAFYALHIFLCKQ